ncbi:hypothetical protein PGT21_014521 [Puccinia graminis f. sp. tritici]|uniref:Uncharacterized protein n=1 Tax=Puccinia graminis f. sp. tritici TaxID=56615 RepID=A0A5B0NFP9_PUCGR|nr:hypothetical protein PGT21_014521 [Puccinia graminis f. sp. tritici]
MDLHKRAGAFEEKMPSFSGLAVLSTSDHAGVRSEHTAKSDQDPERVVRKA